ncbi:substrate-binding domain-containing protein [Aggregatilinea lenta]|uniref:substrate-binding domain-containing protein n=1 Tax=Aggregatilinea lenta TaxID=913108 RepID=UPI000E5A97DA|nr:substrate-binding domain-containing protein [Aggregatilinea lenta]
MRKLNLFVFCLVLVAMSVGSVAAQGDTPFEKKDPFIVGYSVYDMQQPYWQEYARGVEEAATDAGAEFVLSDQKSSQETQVSGSLDLINQGISALVVSPVQPSALPASIDAAHEAKIPVIIGDVGAEGDYDAFVLSDNYEGGKLAAQYVVDQLSDVEGTKQVLVIELHPGSAVGEERAKGFADEIALHDDFEIVASLNGNDTVQGGYQVTQDTLSANPELAAIYATNDPEAIGAAQALKAAGLNGVDDVLLVGFNGDAPALELIEAGEMAATIRQDPYGQGRAAVEAAITLLDGGSIEYSDADSRSIYFPVDVVTADNVAEFMSGEATEEPAGESAFEKKDPFIVGYSVYDMQQPYWQEYARGVEEASADAGAEFVLSDQKSSQETQVSGSLDLINQGISALVVSPVQPSALPASIDAAHEAKIPVIIGDVGAEGDYDAFVLSDNYEGGKLAAQYVVDQLSDVEGTKQVLVIELHPGSAVGEERAKGFADEIALHDDFEIVASLNGNDTVQGGYQVTQDTLSANPELAAIYATNDPEAIGAAQALKAAGLNGVDDVLLVGFNGDAPALELIEAGEMAATIRQDPYGQGRAAVEAAITLLDGGSIEYSDADSRSIFFPVDVVTADNVADFMS